MNENLYKVAFVILHYLSSDVTRRCVDSIRTIITYQNYRIVIVDNGSDNGTGAELRELYEDDENVKVICLKENLGFSAGNNTGYVYAKERLHSDFIIMINNDTEMIQPDFVERMIDAYKEEPYYVLGPDIINLEDIHQSPQRSHVIKRHEAGMWYIKRCLFSGYLHVHRFLGLPEGFFVYQKYLRHDNHRKKNIVSDIRQENVELQGACFIFSPIYIEKNGTAFEELTFMYGEEALLSLRCARNKWRIAYNPDLKIRHAEKMVTGMMHRSNIDKEIFWSDNHVKAIRMILKQMW